jgi:hypothetical protein
MLSSRSAFSNSTRVPAYLNDVSLMLIFGLCGVSLMVLVGYAGLVSPRVMLHSSALAPMHTSISHSIWLWPV